VTAPTRRTYALLALALAAFVAYGSWVPFDFRPRPWGDARSAFEWAMTARARVESRADGLGNLMLGVPLGFALLGAACADRPGAGRAVLAAAGCLPLCTALAMTVEFGQLYLPTRTCAGSDVIAQTIGAAFGMLAWAVAGQWATGHARVVWARAGGAAPRLLVGYLALLAFVQALPLDLSPSPADLYRKLRDAVQYVPFGELTGVPPGFRSRPAAGLPEPLTEAERWRRAAVLIQVFALYLPVGLLAARVKSLPLGIVPLALAAAVGMEALQLLVKSRTSSATDVVVGTLGAACGWAAGRRPAAWWVAAVWCGVLAVHAWQPWTARTDPVAFEWLPGVPLEGGDPIHGLSEVLTKSILFAPLGLFTGRRHAPLVAMAVAAVLEVGQLYVSTRYPGTTDVLVAGFGAWVAATVRRQVSAH
jgi:VanZ family protein